LLDEGAREHDLARRADLLHQAEAIALRELPWIPLMHYRNKALIAPRLRGFHPNLRNAAPTRYLRLGA
jgi:oligopeptide transport system substrate-binding protein